MSDTSIEMNDLMFAALDHAVASIESGGPLVPFVMCIERDGKKTLTRFAGELLEEGLKAAQDYVNREKENLRAYAIAWDGYLTIEAKKWDSVLVEAGENLNELGVLLAQRYEKKGFKNKNVPTGNPAMVERPVSRVFHT